MKKYEHSQVVWRGLLTGALTLGVSGVAGLGPVLACDLKKSSSEQTTMADKEKNGPGQKETAATAGQGSAGMKVHIDPATGAVVPPPAGIIPEITSPAASTSAEGLSERPLPGGGAKVDLQGRFRKPLTATIEDDGKVSIQHADPTPAGK